MQIAEKPFTTAQPRVGIGILVINEEGKILLGERLSYHGKGAWAPPGGHLEMFESIEECVKRELFEETNLVATEIHHGIVSNDIFEESSKHYVTLMMVVTTFEGSLENKEPDKCRGWKWFDYLDLPTPLFTPLANQVRSPHFYRCLAKHTMSSDIAYLASPYAHENRAIMKHRLNIATQMAAHLFEQGVFVFSPLTHNVDIDALTSSKGWQKWKQYDLSLLEHCDRLILLKQPGWEKSVGVADELNFAIKHQMPIEYIEWEEMLAKGLEPSTS